jgi:hypothetical protein
MPYLIGTDEAGYGPNLGPLVVSASVWWVAEPTTGYDLYQRLKGVVCRSAARDGGQRRLAIADSKALYSPAQGLRVLERGVLAALALIDHCPCDWLDVWSLLDPESISHLPTMPWHRDYDLRLPLVADAEELVGLMPRLRAGFDRAGVRLVALASRAVFPERFNRSNEELGNKSETLSKTTLALVADVLRRCAGEPVTIVCDKHGGRNYYQRLLQQQFPDLLVEVLLESRAKSIYRWGAPEERIEVCFRTEGETFMPAALASMAAKYLRELSMRAFNDFWCGRVRDLSPTAGYARDARRFKTEIQDQQVSLDIDDRILWRNC